MRALVIVEKEGKKFGYAFSSSKVKSEKHMQRILEPIFRDYEVISMNITK